MAGLDVQATDTLTVTASSPAAVKALGSSVRLGPFDKMVSPIVPIVTIFVYEASNDAPLLHPQRLRLALERLLNHYPHLTGRFKFGHDRAPAISRLGTGAGLVLATCSAKLDDLRQEGRINVANAPELLPLFDHTLEGVCRDPILMVQRTEFACGGVALGVRIHHIVCASAGFVMLVRHLAEIYRSLREGEVAQEVPVERPPVIKPYLSDLRMDVTEKEEALRFKSRLVFAQEGHKDEVAFVATQLSKGQGPPRVVGRVLRFSKKELQSLKEHALLSSKRPWLSTYDVLSAHLYSRVYRARLTLHDASTLVTDFLTSVDMRGPERLGLPENYFPNAICCAITAPSHDLLANGQLGEIADLMHDVVRSVDREEAERSLRWIEAQPDVGRIRSRFCFAPGCFMVSQWSKFDMYRGVEFDRGSDGHWIGPSAVTTPFTHISLVDGLVYLLNVEPESQGDLDVNLALSEPLWDILERDEGFCS